MLGNNANGQLGRDNTTNIGNDASQGMAGLTDIFMGDGNPKITKIEISGASACALTENSGLRCWGNGDNGKLGSGSTSKIGNSSGNTITNMLDIDFEAPADTVDAADQVVTDFAIYRAMVCATNAAGKIKCWGNNDMGQLDLAIPLPIQGLLQIILGWILDQKWCSFLENTIVIASTVARFRRY